MGGGVIQRNAEILTDTFDAVKYGVAMRKKHIACFFERTAAYKVCVKRFAVLSFFFSVMRCKFTQFRRNNVFIAFKPFQHKRCAQL